MTGVPIFHGRIDEDGRFGLLATEKALRLAYFKRLAGERVEVIVRKARTQRSIDQNKYLHAVPFPILALHFGDSVEGVKFDLMGEKWGWTTTKQGHHIPVKGHTSQMTVEECTEFIDWLIPWAMTEHGVAIPLPNEVEA